MSARRGADVDPWPLRPPFCAVPFRRRAGCFANLLPGFNAARHAHRGAHAPARRAGRGRRGLIWRRFFAGLDYIAYFRARRCWAGHPRCARTARRIIETHWPSLFRPGFWSPAGIAHALAVAPRGRARDRGRWPRRPMNRSRSNHRGGVIRKRVLWVTARASNLDVSARARGLAATGRRPMQIVGALGARWCRGSCA